MDSFPFLFPFSSFTKDRYVILAGGQCNRAGGKEWTQEESLTSSRSRAMNEPPDINQIFLHPFLSPVRRLYSRRLSSSPLSQPAHTHQAPRPRVSPPHRIPLLVRRIRDQATSLPSSWGFTSLGLLPSLNVPYLSFPSLTFSQLPSLNRAASGLA